MKGTYASHYLPHNIYLVQLGHRNNLQSILRNWIHSLLEEPTLKVQSTASHSNEFFDFSLISIQHV